MLATGCLHAGACPSSCPGPSWQPWGSCAFSFLSNVSTRGPGGGPPAGLWGQVVKRTGCCLVLCRCVVALALTRWTSFFRYRLPHYLFLPWSRCIFCQFLISDFWSNRCCNSFHPVLQPHSIGHSWFSLCLGVSRFLRPSTLLPSRGTAPGPGGCSCSPQSCCHPLKCALPARLLPDNMYLGQRCEMWFDL